MEINFYREDCTLQIKEEDTIRHWIAETIYKELSTDVGEISVIFCSDEFLYDINVQYLDHHYYTDIITFPYTDSPLSADLYISIDRVIDNANSFNIPFSNELYRVIIHGILHLCGHNDQTKSDQLKIRNLEDKYLRELPEGCFDKI